jgi:transposase InsO family protein
MKERAARMVGEIRGNYGNEHAAVRSTAARLGTRRMRADHEDVYGARKTWPELNRRKVSAARCTVERVLARDGLCDVGRGRKVRTTVPGKGPGHERAKGLLKRDFTAPAPHAARTSVIASYTATPLCTRGTT